MSDEIVLIGEKKTIPKKYYIAWPGDETHEKKNGIEEETPIVSKPPEFTYSTEPMDNYREVNRAPYKKKFTNEKDTRLNSMKNRYFSIENQVQESNQPEIFKVASGEIHPDDLDTSFKKDIAVKDDASTETPAFVQRRDYLLKKLMKCHTLPGLEETESKNAETGTQNLQEDDQASTSNNMIPRQPARERKFLDDYIPLFGSSVKRKQPESSDDEEEVEKKIESSDSDSVTTDSDVKIIFGKDYNPRVETIENYRGPYPIECLKRSRRTLIEEFVPNSKATNRSNFFDRRFEILKMKLRIKSKFDKDNRLWNKMRRETAQIKQDICDRIVARDRRFDYFTKNQNNNSAAKNKNKKIIFTSDSDDDSILYFDDKSYNKTKPSTSSDVIKLSNRKSVKSINLDDTLSNSGSGSDTMNEEDVIRMITQPEYCLNVAETESDDSKCKQFGKYTNKSKPISKQSKKKPKPLDSSLKRTKKNAKTKLAKNKNESVAKRVKENFRIDRVGLKSSGDDEYNELKNRYKILRNKRNKVLRKKKDNDIERKIMSDELKQIRSQMKKLRRKKKITMDKSEMASYNPLDMVRNSDSKKPKKKKTTEKKKGKKIAKKMAVKSEQPTKPKKKLSRKAKKTIRSNNSKLTNINQ